MEQYDNHMRLILPKPELLPIRVDICLEKIGEGDKVVTIDLPNLFQVKPYETVDTLIRIIKDFFADKRQDEIKKFDLDKISIRGPLYQDGLVGVTAMGDGKVGLDG